MARDFDEDDVRVRPQRGKSRPRSKSRPAHESASIGRVTAVDRGRFTAITADDIAVYAVKSRELGRKGVVVGDEVALVGDLSGRPDSLARIVRVEPRRTLLRRTADDTDPVERVLVANAEMLAVVTAAADPEPRAGLIDRCLVAAFDAGLKPVIIVTKADLRDPVELRDLYGDLDVPFVMSSLVDGVPDGIEALRELFRDRSTVLVGHSGVGKSTLVNALVPAADRATGRVNTVTGRGRHTSSSAVALPLHDARGDVEGWIIDTPGVRSFGLAHVDTARVIHAFPEFEAGTEGCPRSCGHLSEAADECALDQWAADGNAGPSGAARLASLRRLLIGSASDA